MKYAEFVIFGAGVRAKRIVKILGIDRVIAFVDNYPSSHDLFNKPVISIEDYLNHYNDYILVISPMICGDIISLVEVKGIKHYLVYSECPSEFIHDIQLDSNIKKIKDYVIEKGNSMDRILVYGESLFSIVVYEWLIESGARTELNICDEDTERKVAIQERLKGYVFGDGHDIIGNYNVAVLNCTKRQISQLDGIGDNNIFDIHNLKSALGEYIDTSMSVFKNIHKKDKRCFIVATGPSLKISDLNFLHKNRVICISMNKIFYAFDETMWRPDYYLASDPLVTKACREEICQMEAKAKFIGELDASFWEGEQDDNIFKIHQEKQTNHEYRFSGDLSRAFEQAHTTTFLAIQLAAYMGFDEIYLLGVDHTGGAYVNSPERHFYGGKDENAIPMRMEEESFKRIEGNYIEAERYSRNNGFRIYNATRGGRLEVFERVDIDEIFDQIKYDEKSAVTDI
ncbi:6-hydroxymethylpterin diphosphokinase MptE-like protein [Butyrivibrio sp. AC2005]|uniref:6-hydroxymethylpterin diphosphokinase MptE-like protein n=1 Tax=Butyrivibrio sp. AC2005 TaxID=1280672 RepID=UPI0003FA6C0F|nr:6-hydroxymethylpterin diphosphokinase MptE-like protein [Butyrivibrio sp. AC2005]